MPCRSFADRAAGGPQGDLGFPASNETDGGISPTSRIATFAAAVGGAESITVLPHDTAWGLPTPFSRRMARNLQLLAAEESNLGRVADPAGGSWYVESLTDQLAAKAWARFQQLEAAGGMAQALADGLVAQWVDETTAARAVRLANRRQPITGVSMFPAVNETPLDVRPRPESPVFGGLAPRRDSEVFEGLRDRVAAADPQPQVFLACLGARPDERLRRHYENRERDYLLIAQGTRPLLDDQRRGHAARQTADRRVYSVYPADNGEECKQLPGKNQHCQQSNAPVGDKL